MSLRILIFDRDPAIRRLLETCLSRRGHQVRTFTDPTFCTLYQRSVCLCPQAAPCADVLIADIRLRDGNAIAFIHDQTRRGCRANLADKAIMSASLTRDQKEEIEQLGCHPIKKPFRLVEVLAWVDACAARIAEVD